MLCLYFNQPHKFPVLTLRQGGRSYFPRLFRCSYWLLVIYNII